MKIYNNIHIIINNLLHISGLMATSSRRTLSYAQIIVKFFITDFKLHYTWPMFFLKMAQ